MSNASSDISPPEVKSSWNGWLGAAAALVIFFGAQFVGGFLVSIYPLLRGWSHSRAQTWLTDNLAVQLTYLAVVNALIIGGIWLFLKYYRQGFASIGLRRPKFSDPLYSVLALPVYFIILAVALSAIKLAVPSLDLNQTQDLGFNGTYNGGELVFIAISLVVLPPLVEEIAFRGLVFGSLKKKLPVIAAVVLTSLLFAAGHLPEGGDGGLLYVAAIDTFILSLVLIYLRQKTGGLWAPIGLHALKNGIAFASLFLVHLR